MLPTQPQYLNTPILYVVFNRPDLVELSFAVIRQIKPKQLYIAADGPRSSRPEESKLCDSVRRIVSDIDWECDVKKLFHSENLGCTRAVRSAISWFFSEVEEGIIVEDDCLLDLSFFKFCEELLERYRSNSRVMAICAESFGGAGFWNSCSSYVFSAMPLVWGWATWRRAWETYDMELSLLEQPRIGEWLSSYMLSEKAGKYWLQQLSMARDGQIDTWDYAWMASVWVEGGLAIHPNKNLVSNIGCDSRATHTVDPYWEMGNRNHETLENELKHPSGVLRDHQYDRHVLRERFGLEEPNGAVRSRLSAVGRLLQSARRIANRVRLEFVRKE